MSENHLAILGGGNMGRALIGGLLRRGTRPEHIRVGEHLEGARAALSRDFGILADEDNTAAVQTASLVVIAVKPQDARSVVEPLRAMLQRTRPVVVSIVAGVRLAALQSWCGAGVAVVRAMPNRPALIGMGATGLYAPDSVTAAQRETAQRAMQAVGEIVWLASEELLDVVTALSGSGPAYFFLLAELLTQAAVGLGLEPATAQRLALATLQGSGQLAASGDGDFVRLRKEVTSKGGTTEAAVRVFDAVDLRGIVARAVDAAAVRSRELATQFGAER